MKHSRTFNSSATALTFPLGGLGTGTVSLGARGEMRDWEIFNASAKGNHLPNTFFAIRVQAPGQAPVLRVLEGALQPPFNASHGYHPSQNGGLPRFAHSRFTGEYPLAWVDLDDPNVPVKVQLEAFNPLLPLNPDDSGIPVVSLTYSVTNISNQPLAITLAGSLCNAVGGVQFDPFMNIVRSKQGQTRNQFREEAGMRGIFMDAAGIAGDDVLFGSMGLVTTCENVTVKPQWLRSGWWDFLQEYWDDLADDGVFTDLNYPLESPDGRPDSAALGVTDTLQPGEMRRYPFWITWHFPNRHNSWHGAQTVAAGAKPTIRNHYAVQFADAWDVARYAVSEWPRLSAETYKFHDAFFSSTLPEYVLDAVSANIVPMRSNTCFWLEDGRFYGWEGCFDDGGCCAGSCTHVWSYAYSMAYLFPSLEREMRRIEFEIETEDDGYMSFRNLKSLGEFFVWTWADQPKAEPAVDGQMGSILRAYRDWQLSGDRAWLEHLWPAIKRALEFASLHWDTDGDFVLDSKQHNTYDIEFYGPNPLSNIYFMAALRAVEIMAIELGKPDIAQRCRQAFEASSSKFDALCWNGEYYIQHLDDVDAHKYQHGLGCLSDQLLGQLHAHALGLGYLLPAEHVRKAIRSVFDHNFLPDFTNHSNCQRTYVLNDEAGLLLCTWPNGGRPKFPFVYSDEVWPGIEYHVAAELIYDGWLEQGLKLVETVRARHEGTRRSPWDEVECGHHYARSMSSWTVLLALSGQKIDRAAGGLTFNPVLEASTDPDVFQCFWSNGTAWGVFRQPRDGSSAPEIVVMGGSLNEAEASATSVGTSAGPAQTDRKG